MAKKNKKAVEIKEPKCIYLVYDEDRSGGQICAGQENDSWPSHEDAYIEFEPRFITTKAPSWSETIEVDFEPNNFVGKDIHLVIVRYSTGSTFGSTKGAWYIVGAFTDIQKARAIERQIRGGTYGSKDKYVHWIGYFESFESVDVHTFELEDSRKET